MGTSLMHKAKSAAVQATADDRYAQAVQLFLSLCYQLLRGS